MCQQQNTPYRKHEDKDLTSIDYVMTKLSSLRCTARAGLDLAIHEQGKANNLAGLFELMDDALDAVENTLGDMELRRSLNP